VTHFWFGAAAVKSRSSRSGARRESFPPGMVVRCLRPLTTPDRPSSPIRRSTGAQRHPMALAAQIRRHLPSPVQVFGCADGGPQRIDEMSIRDHPRRRRGALPVAVRASGDLHTMLTEHPADRLDPR